MSTIANLSRSLATQCLQGSQLPVTRFRMSFASISDSLKRGRPSQRSRLPLKPSVQIVLMSDLPSVSVIGLLTTFVTPAPPLKEGPSTAWTCRAIRFGFPHHTKSLNGPMLRIGINAFFSTVKAGAPPSSCNRSTLVIQNPICGVGDREYLFAGVCFLGEGRKVFRSAHRRRVAAHQRHECQNASLNNREIQRSCLCIQASRICFPRWESYDAGTASRHVSNGQSAFHLCFHKRTSVCCGNRSQRLGPRGTTLAGFSRFQTDQ